MAENAPPGDDGYTELVMRILQQAIIDAIALPNGATTFERKKHKVSPMPAKDDIRLFFSSEYFELYCDYLSLDPAYVRRLLRERLAHTQGGNT